MNSTLTLYRLLICHSVVCLFSAFSAYATHIVGADLYYAHISGNKYKITVALYGDCGSVSGAFATLMYSQPQVCIMNGLTSVVTLGLVLDTSASNIEITRLCPGDSSNCTNPASIIPGIKKFVYSAYYTLPTVSSKWRFIYTGINGSGSSAGRSPAITNIDVGGGVDLIQLIDTLNNSVHNNTSALLTSSQQTFFCVLQHDVYQPAAFDPDEDSLTFSLIPAVNSAVGCSGTGTPATYLGAAWPGGTPTTASTPIQTVSPDSFSLNTATGDLFFHPFYQRSVVVYNIREFRNDTLIGTTQREMTVLVIDCDSTFPCLKLGPVIALGTSVAAGAVRAELYPNPSNSELTIKIPHASFTSFALYDGVGRVLLQQPLHSDITTVDVSSLSPGLYYVMLKGASGSEAHKFIKM